MGCTNFLIQHLSCQVRSKDQREPYICDLTNLDKVVFTFAALIVVLQSIERGEMLVSNHTAGGRAGFLLTGPGPILTNTASDRTKFSCFPGSFAADSLFW